MLFSEVYSAYYRAVGQILCEAVAGSLTEERMKAIVCDMAFGESHTVIPAALKSERWQLITKDYRTPLKQAPLPALTHLQRRWLKAISLDPRVKLFDMVFGDLEDVTPLFRPEDLYYFDRYTDGDPFEDPGYIRRFRRIRTATQTHQPLHVTIRGRSGRLISFPVIPEYLEYSEKDDKFRLITSGNHYASTLNLAKIQHCQYYYENDIRREVVQTPTPARVTFYLHDVRKALERAMFHFAHFEKEVEQIGTDLYRVTLLYDESDESEMVIRILSFGPFLQVVEPESFVARIKEKLNAQMKCGL